MTAIAMMLLGLACQADRLQTRLVTWEVMRGLSRQQLAYMSPNVVTICAIRSENQSFIWRPLPYQMTDRYPGTSHEGTCPANLR